MKVCFESTLFWLAHLLLLSLINGAETDESYKPRRWMPAGDGHYRLVVSSEMETLEGEESVSLAAAQEKKRKDKPSQDELTDKVTQRIVLKRSRKRLPVELLNPRKRRRNPLSSAVSTTGLPQTMSYNLYNHFRPLEQDVPQDHILPFLDFGRKLSTGSTPSGINSIESSSTPRGEAPEVKDVHENLMNEEMDVTVMNKAVERNSVPRGPIQMKPHIAASFFRRNSTTELIPVHKTNDTHAAASNKIELKNLHYDLQSNESGVKVQAVLSPNYGLKLNKTENESRPAEEGTLKSEVTKGIDNSSTTEIPAKVDEPKNGTQAQKGNETSSAEESVPSPKPTARILSTAVVTSVSVKESPRLPRIKSNYTKPEIHQRLQIKNFTSEHLNHSTMHVNLEGRLRGDNHTLINLQSRRKIYTTMRPKTTTYRPVVTFRNVLRRNFTGLGSPGVVHILSTPPTYIEVPKILASAPKSETNQTAISTTLKPVVHFISKQTEASTVKTTTDVTTSRTTESTSATTDVTTPRTTESTSTTTEPPTTVTPTTTSSTTTTTTTAAPIDTTPSSTTARTTSDGGEEEIPAENTVHESDESQVLEQTTYHFGNETVQIEIQTLDVEKVRAEEAAEKEQSSRRPAHHGTYTYNQRNHSVVRTQSVGVAFPESQIGLVTYVLAGLALIPLILGLSVLARQVFKKSKKKVLDESEYSSEYNRTPLPTKLPRVPAHINWEGEKPPQKPLPALPVTKWEFSRDKLRLQTVLGQGNFGQVWKAEADDLSGHEGSTRLVAVKTVKEGANLREKEDLLRELGIMQELGAHPNVVTLLGCCTDKEPYLLIMEYVMYGKLLAFLREHRTRAHYFNFSDLSSALTSRDLTFFAYCVARGMEYLVTKGIIHRDLAARNILVDHTKLCKIADFGMSRNVQDTGQIYEQRPNRGALPIRWMAPESLHLSLFTHKSDVWSFGILLWEIITLGSTPYNKMGAREVMRQVREGYRLEKPKHCRSEFYKVLTKCWHTDPSKRPSFTDLKQDIASLLGDEQTNGEYVDLEALTEEMCDQSS